MNVEKPAVKYCDCPDWAPNVNYITGVMQRTAYHATIYNITPFLYCPWCGKKLKEKENNDQRA